MRSARRLAKYQRIYKCISMLICLSICLSFLLIGTAHYATNDDVTHNFIAIGNYGPQHASNLPFSNICYGSIFAFFYRICDTINWYGVLPIVLSITSFVLIAAVFVESNKHIGGIIIPAIFTLMFGRDILIDYQFTHFAAFFSAIGLFLMYSSLLEDEVPIYYAFFGIPIALVGYWIRRDAFMSVSAIACICLLIKILRKRFWKLDKKVILKHLSPYVLILLLFIGSEVADSIAYSDPDWQYWREYNTYRAGLMDHPIPDFDTYQQEYQEMGLDKQDFDLFCSWNYADQNKFSLETLKSMYELQQEVRVADFEFFNEMDKLLKNFSASCTEHLAFPILLAAMIIVVFWRKGNWWMLIPLFVFLGELFYLSYIGRFIYRSYLGLWLIVGLVILESSVTYIRKFSYYQTFGILISAIVVTLPSFYDLWLEHYVIDDHLNAQMQKYEFKETLSADTESLYVSETLTGAFPGSMSPLVVPPKYFHNQYCLGGWTNPSPLQQDLLKQHALEDGIMLGMIDDSKNVFYIEGWDESWRDRLLAYLRKEYGEHIHFERVDAISNIHVYRFYEDKAQGSGDPSVIETAYKLDRAVKNKEVDYSLTLSEDDGFYFVNGWGLAEGIDPYKQNVWLRISSPLKEDAPVYVRSLKQVVHELVEQTGDQHSAAAGVLFVFEKQLATDDYTAELIIESNGTAVSKDVTKSLSELIDKAS